MYGYSRTIGGSKLRFAGQQVPEFARLSLRAAATDGSSSQKIILQKITGEDATFAPLDEDSEGGLGGTSNDVFGPLALLQIGYTEREFQAIRRFMDAMDAQMVDIYSADEVALKGSLCDAFSGEPGFKQAPAGFSKAIIMSGMYTSEVMEVIAAYKDSGLPPTVFAGAVPKNWDWQLDGLLEELYNDAAASANQTDQDRA